MKEYVYVPACRCSRCRERLYSTKVSGRWQSLSWLLCSSSLLSYSPNPATFKSFTNTCRNPKVWSRKRTERWGFSRPDHDSCSEYKARPDVCIPLQITELSKEVFRLKEALGALTPPLGITSSSSTTHHNNPGQQVALQNRISTLTQQLQVRTRQWWESSEVGIVEKRNPERLVLTSACNVFPLLQDWEKKHKHVVTIYRSHLLAAVQVSSVQAYL